MQKPVVVAKNGGSAKLNGSDLTPRMLEFVRQFVANGKNGVQAALAAYPNQTYGSAEQTVNRLLGDRRILERIAEIDVEIEDTLLDVMREARKEYKNTKSVPQGALAADQARYLHDKRHGKATQRTESANVSVSIEMDLSSAVS